MTNYVVRILSFKSHSIDITQSLLTCPTLSKLIFPAILNTSPSSSIPLASADQFDVALVPEEFFGESFVGIPLHGENGIKFFISISEGEKVTPDVINLKFESKHLQLGTVTMADLKALLAEVIPLFRTSHASVYDERAGQRSDGIKRFRSPSFRSYPLDLEWITYFGSEMMEFLGRERESPRL